MALLALFSAALGGFATALIQGTTTREVEQKRFEAQLVLKAIETGDTTKASTNRVFLMKAGFIQDPDGKIAALVRNPQTIPVLPFRRNDRDEGDGGAGAGMRSQPRQSGREKAARDPHVEKRTFNVEVIRARRRWPDRILHDTNVGMLRQLATLPSVVEGSKFSSLPVLEETDILRIRIADFVTGLRGTQNG